MQILFQNGVTKAVNKYEFLLHVGEICRRVYFIKSGVIRHFVIDSDNCEKTIRISKEDDFFYSSIVSHFTNEPSYINCQALTDCYLMYWEKEDLELLIEKHQELKEVHDQQLINFILQKHNKEISLITKDTAMRLEEFNDTRISLFNRIPHHIIASYLNMTPETLSRLRAR